MPDELPVSAIRGDIGALAFDVFGTVADWRGSIREQGERRLVGARFHVDWDAFVDDWAAIYGQSVRLMKEWRPLDEIMTSAYWRVSGKHGLGWLPNTEGLAFSQAWSELKAFPDATDGFAMLKGRVHLAALTNANKHMLSRLAVSTRLPWGRLLSAESVRKYKPDPAIYKMAIDELNLAPKAIMMVAAHTFDLNAAHRAGMRTALITRKGEPGSEPSGLDHEADIIASDIAEFAQRLIGEPR